MLFTRSKRLAVWITMVTLAVALAVGTVGWPSKVRYATFLSGWPVMSEGEKSFYTVGVTRWLIVERREIPSDTSAAPAAPRFERRYRIHAPGLLEALALLALGTLACTGAFRVLVHRLPLRERCDRCGYPRRGLRGPRCPECGLSWAKVESRDPGH